MKNISNCEIDADKCTKCPTCNKPSWYIMKCECGYVFCKNCSVYQNSDDADTSLFLECPNCGAVQIFV